jgi:hypothetical protein
MPSKSANKTKKPRGRQSDFSGDKQAYLDSLAKDFLNRKDRSAFYDEAAQGLIDNFGYSRDGKVYVEADSLTPDEKSEYYQALRNVSIPLALRIYRKTKRGLVRKWDNGSDTETWANLRTAPMWRR